MFQKIIEIFNNWFERFLRRDNKYFMMKYLMVGPYMEGPYNRYCDEYGYID